MSAVRRLTKEYRDIDENKIDGLEVELVDDNLHLWKGCIIGGEDSYYSGGIFKFEISFPKEYPFKPPQFTFKTKIYHPGVNESGKICVAELRDDMWKPANTMRAILITIQTRLNYPKPDDEPFEHEILSQLKTDPEAFKAKAREWVAKYAGASQ